MYLLPNEKQMASKYSNTHQYFGWSPVYRQGHKRVAVGGKPAENTASGRLWPGMGIDCSEGRHRYKC